ncbi:MAG: FG-GAP repeat protein [Solirubrobacterales bacterium]
MLSGGVRCAAPAYVAILVAAALPASAGADAYQADFNGDDYADLAVGAPGEAVGPFEEAGAVNVIYSSDAGLASPGDQLWHQEIPGVPDSAEPSPTSDPEDHPDSFGRSLASGDFDDDGFADLAIGVPDEVHSGANFAGAVQVLYGSEGGLTTQGNQFFHQGTPGIPSAPLSREAFGWAVTSGDLNGDGVDDLVVGARLDAVGGIEAGSVMSVNGVAGTGLDMTSAKLFAQSSPGIVGAAAAYDEFGFALTSGAFDDDAFADLAVGVPGDEGKKGGVNILYGGPSGISAQDNRRFSQDTGTIRGVGEGVESEWGRDQFGSTVAAGDFDSTGTDDLAIAAPYETRKKPPNAAFGMVHVLYSDDFIGITDVGNQLWHQDVDGVLGAGAGSGHDLTAGSFDADGADDLAIGSPQGNDVPTVEGHGTPGAVNVLYGTNGTGLTAIDNQFFHGNNDGVPPGAKAFDDFGMAVFAADFDLNGASDLAIGLGNRAFSPGFVNVLYSDLGIGLQTSGAQSWSQNSPGIEGVAELRDGFGESLTD